jgi:hypothetical protein
LASPGEPVVERQVLERLGVSLALGDVTHEGEREGALAVLISPRSSSIGERGAVRATTERLGRQVRRALCVGSAGRVRPSPRSSSRHSGAIMKANGCPTGSPRVVAEQPAAPPVDRFDHAASSRMKIPSATLSSTACVRLAVAQRRVERRDRLERALQLLGLHEQVDECRDLGPQHSGRTGVKMKSTAPLAYALATSPRHARRR